VAKIVLDSVTKQYHGGVTGIDQIDLHVADGEFMALVGPSGCGKSTALRSIAGLEQITAGTITIGDRVVNDLPPRDRDIAMVFQNYALYPHMTVAENLAFGLRQRKTPKAEIQRRVSEVAAMLGLAEYLGRKPAALSGGQRQRVAMGRAIVREPQAFLMDEPLSNLDAKLRMSTTRPRTPGSASAFSHRANISSGRSAASPPSSRIGSVVASATRSISSTTGSLSQL